MTTSRLLAAAAALVAGMAFAGTASASTVGVDLGNDRVVAFDGDSASDVAPAGAMARRGEPEQRGRANETVHNQNRRGRGR